MNLLTGCWLTAESLFADFGFGNEAFFHSIINRNGCMMANVFKSNGNSSCYQPKTLWWFYPLAVLQLNEKGETHHVVQRLDLVVGRPKFFS